MLADTATSFDPADTAPSSDPGRSDQQISGQFAEMRNLRLVLRHNVAELLQEGT